MKTIDDAMQLRRRILGALELAETAGTPTERQEWLTVVVVGAGPTGVEIAGQIRELAQRSLDREFSAPSCNPPHFRLEARPGDPSADESSISEDAPHHPTD